MHQKSRDSGENRKGCIETKSPSFDWRFPWAWDPISCSPAEQAKFSVVLKYFVICCLSYVLLFHRRKISHVPRNREFDEKSARNVSFNHLRITAGGIPRTTPSRKLDISLGLECLWLMGERGGGRNEEKNLCLHQTHSENYGKDGAVLQSV